MTPVSRLQAVWLPTYSPEEVERIGRRALFYTAFGSAASILFSIAISQILLVAGLLILAALQPTLHLPPIRLPLALFFAATILADLLSGHPHAGAPQVRKLFVFGIILLVSSAFR